MIIGVTGHRPNKLGGYSDETFKKLTTFAVSILSGIKDVDRVMTGMALGWDQAVAAACIELKLPFTAAVPFIGQERMWPTTSQNKYNELLKYSDDVVCTDTDDNHIELPIFTKDKRIIGVISQKLQNRNKYIVDKCDVLYALWDGTSGGTANCVRYAKKSNVDIVNCWDKWMIINAFM